MRRRPLRQGRGELIETQSCLIRFAALRLGAWDVRRPRSMVYAPKRPALSDGGEDDAVEGGAEDDAAEDGARGDGEADGERAAPARPEVNAATTTRVLIMGDTPSSRKA